MASSSVATRDDASTSGPGVSGVAARRAPPIDPVVERPARVETPVAEIDVEATTDSEAATGLEVAMDAEVATDSDVAADATDSEVAADFELATDSEVTADRESVREDPTLVEGADAAADTRTSDVVAPRGSAAGRATRVSGASSSPTTARA